MALTPSKTEATLIADEYFPFLQFDLSIKGRTVDKVVALGKLETQRACMLKSLPQFA